MEVPIRLRLRILVAELEKTLYFAELVASLVHPFLEVAVGINLVDLEPELLRARKQIN